MSQKGHAEKAVGEIRRKTRRKFSAGEKIRIVLEGLRGKEIIAQLRGAGVALSKGKTVPEAYRNLGVTEKTYYRWRMECGGLAVDEVERFKKLEKGNRRSAQGRDRSQLMASITNF